MTAVEDPTPAAGAVVIAVDKFKGSVTAGEAAAAMAAGIRAVVADARISEVPVADGGEGSLDLLLATGFEARRVPVEGPTGAAHDARIAVRGACAFVELAEVCGSQRLPAGRPAPHDASSHGLGTAIRAALDLGCREVRIGLGGSASTDGGIGLLVALGARVLDADGLLVPAGAAGLLAARAVDLSALDPRLAGVSVAALADVRAPLTGPHGAVARYGPQKGVPPADIPALDAALARWGGLLTAATGRPAAVPGAGAAGGVGAAVVTALRGVVGSGAEELLDRIGFDALLDGAALVVTGEGRWDDQTGAGKAPCAVLGRALRRGIPAVVVAGRIDAPPPEWVVGGYALVDLEPDAGRAMALARPLLTRVGGSIGRRLLARRAEPTRIPTGGGC